MISVVIPAYNESSRLPKTLAELECYHKDNSGIISEVIVVDDGSTDHGTTVSRAMYYMDRLPLHIECLAKNSGKWQAITRGINLSKNDSVLIMDADGSASIYNLDKLEIDEVVSKRISIFGSRFAAKSVVSGKSVFRSIVSKGYSILAKFVYLYVERRLCLVQDTQAPFKLIHKSRLQGDFFVSPRFSGDINLIILCSGPSVNLPLDFIHLRGGSVKLWTIWDMFWETLVSAFKLRRFRKSSKRTVLLYLLRNHNLYKGASFSTLR